MPSALKRRRRKDNIVTKEWTYPRMTVHQWFQSMGLTGGGKKAYKKKKRARLLERRRRARLHINRRFDHRKRRKT